MHRNSLVSWLLVTLISAAFMGCGSSEVGAGMGQPDATVGSDTSPGDDTRVAPDSVTPPAPAEPPAGASLSSGAQSVSSPRYHGSIVIGGPAGELSGAQHRGNLGALNP